MSLRPRKLWKNDRCSREVMFSTVPMASIASSLSPAWSRRKSPMEQPSKSRITRAQPSSHSSNGLFTRTPSTISE